LIEEITGEMNGPAIIFEDNLGAIFLAKNAQVSARTKHIDVRHHFIRDLIKEKQLTIKFVKSEDNPADIMTKNTNRDLFQKHSKNITHGTLPCWREDVNSDQTELSPEANLVYQTDRLTDKTDKSLSHCSDPSSQDENISN
jgi:hypothetical protein